MVCTPHEGRKQDCAELAKLWNDSTSTRVLDRRCGQFEIIHSRVKASISKKHPKLQPPSSLDYRARHRPQLRNYSKIVLLANGGKGYYWVLLLFLKIVRYLFQKWPESPKSHYFYLVKKNQLSDFHYITPPDQYSISNASKKSFMASFETSDIRTSPSNSQTS